MHGTLLFNYYSFSSFLYLDLCFYSYPLFFSHLLIFLLTLQDPLIFPYFYMLFLLSSIVWTICLSISCPILLLIVPLPRDHTVPSLLFLNIVLVMHSPLKYAMNPSCIMSHNFYIYCVSHYVYLFECIYP